MTSSIASETRLQDQVKTALSESTALYIQGGNSKAFYGNTPENPIESEYILDSSQHSGIVDYKPSELCLTVRAGTRVIDLEAELAKHQQILPFEPPIYTRDTTIGGAVSAGLSGPRRPYSGAVRDAVLGVKIINGHGEVISFGGQVMKNVAGYDITRLMTGSLGTLGVILEISIKVIPKPMVEKTFLLPCSYEDSSQEFTSLRTSGLPITASCFIDETICVRISGSDSHIESLTKQYHFNRLEEGSSFWQGIRNHTHSFFQNDKPLWRLSVTPSASPINAQANQPNLIEWGGGIRWFTSNTPTNLIQGIAKKRGGHATLFRGSVVGVQTFPTPEPALFNLYKSLKKRLDPKGVFNPERLYKDL